MKVGMMIWVTQTSASVSEGWISGDRDKQILHKRGKVLEIHYSLPAIRVALNEDSYPERWLHHIDLQESKEHIYKTETFDINNLIVGV